MGESDPDWTGALDWAQRIAAGRDPGDRADLTRGAFDALGAGRQWRLAFLLIVRVARTCPVALHDVLGCPSLLLLVPTHEPLTAFDVASVGGMRDAERGVRRVDVARLLRARRREDGARILLQGLWHRLTTGRRGRVEVEREVAAVLGLFGEEHALVGTIRDLCVSALDTIDRVRAEDEANAVPGVDSDGAGGDAVTARVVREFQATDLTVSGVWVEDVIGRRSAVTRVSLCFVDGLLDEIRLANDDGAVHLTDGFLADPGAWPEWLCLVVGRLMQRDTCPDCEHLATVGVASAHHPACPTRR